jgi:hypothetical protein
MILSSWPTCDKTEILRLRSNPWSAGSVAADGDTRNVVVQRRDSRFTRHPEIGLFGINLL